MTPEELKKQFEPKDGKSILADPQVLAARFSPCGKFLLAGSFDARVRRWDIAQEEPAELESCGGHNGWLTAMAFASSGDTLFSGDSWGQIKAWPYADEKPAARWSNATAHDGWVRDLSVSLDGKTIVSCGADHKVLFWNAADGKQLRELDHGGEDVFKVRFHPDGKTLFTADMKGRVKQWNTADWKVVREFDASVLFKLDRLQDVGGVRSLAFDHGGNRLAVGGTKVGNGGSVTGVPTLLLFDIATGELKQTLSFGGTQDVYVTDILFHTAGFLMVTTSGQPGNGNLLFQRPEDKEPFFSAKKMVNCHSLSLHPDGLRLAVVATNNGSNGNGRRLGKNGEYEGNKSPIHLFQFPAPKQA